MSDSQVVEEVSKPKSNSVDSVAKNIYNDGRWSVEEKKLFEEAFEEYGPKWSNLAKVIKTRTNEQIRSHAQKRFTREAREKREKTERQEAVESLKNNGGKMVLRKNEAVKYTELGRIPKAIPKQKKKKEVKISKATGSEKKVNASFGENFNQNVRMATQNITSNLLRTIVETDLEIQRKNRMNE